MSDTLKPTLDATTDFGANSWLVEEMYEQFSRDPQSVGDSWREFFSDYRSVTAPATPTTNGASNASVPTNGTSSSNGSRVPDGSAVRSIQSADEGAEPIRGAGAAIVSNMERSLTVPTATSFRNVPAKLLEVNRSVINGYRNRTGQSKVSYTHIIAYAIVRAIADAVPVMGNGYVEGADGKPQLLRR
ncbi:MAG: 2-oxoglutarate dehydrogenase E1 subunit family protein, partial [Actinomycetota bacterium]